MAAAEPELPIDPPAEPDALPLMPELPVPDGDVPVVDPAAPVPAAVFNLG